jgi:hypothetical protein
MNINTSTKNMFSVPLIQMEVANWQEKKKKLLEMYDKVKIEYKDNVWTNYHDNYKNLNQDICLLLKDEILELHSIFGFNKTQVSSVWFERSFKNDSHCPHNHGGFVQCVLLNMIKIAIKQQISLHHF